MKLDRVYIENVGIIRKLETRCNGQIIVVTGANGTGKTTALRAVQCVIDGGHQPDLIGPYGQKATVELEFDNGWRFRREWTAKNYTLKGWSADGGKIDSPASTLKELFESEYSLNPTGLIDAKPADRVAFLHKAMPMEFSAQEIAQATGEPVTWFEPVMRVDGLDKIRQGRYESRTVANVEWRKLKESRDKMAESLPDGDPLALTWVETAEGIDGQAKPVPEPVNPLNPVRSLEKKLDQAKASLQSALNAWRNTFDQVERSLNEQEDVELEAIRSKYFERRKEARSAYDSLVVAERKPFDQYIEQVAGELATAQERAQQQAKLEGLRDAIRGVDQRLKAAQDEALRLDNAVKNLDELKRRKLETLPIPGVEVRDGRIFYEGKDFETQVNTAKQYLLSTQIAALTLEKFPFLIVDNTEAMDEENRREYIEGLKACGFQAMLAAVEDESALTVSVV